MERNHLPVETQGTVSTASQRVYKGFWKPGLRGDGGRQRAACNGTDRGVETPTSPDALLSSGTRVPGMLTQF